ncbi:hypothetical protein DSO57_1022208 [Entomophthora muscae]|uniref:Uncharacterized protein n=1 Tax=Entomophthora muscae TaxID=34485 RepID=A0ACC2T3I8_9FUNG|nr:hypothetical protein DSO57_1022208 [Entomophthora muscae]
MSSRSRSTPQFSHLESIHEESNSIIQTRQSIKDQPIFPELKAKANETLLSSSSPSLTSPTFPRFSRKGSASTIFHTAMHQPFSLGKASFQHDIFSILHESDEPSQMNFKGIIDLPSVPKTFIRKVKKTDLDAYLSEMTGIFGEYQRLKKENAELLDPTYNSETEPEPEALELPVIQGLPEYFYDPEFSLDQAKTFQAVCSLVRSEDIVESEVALMTSPEIQDILTHNLDLVEAQLVQEIGRRSRGFFSALSMLQDLQEETNACVEHISELRASLENVRQRQVNDSKSIIHLKKRRENMVAFKEAIQIIKNAVDSKFALRGLIENRDPLSAINLIDELSKQLYTLVDFQSRSNSLGISENAIVFNTNPGPHSRQSSLQTDFVKGDAIKKSGLGQLNCLSSLNSFLEDIRFRVIVLLESRFMDIFFGDLMRSIVAGIHLPVVIAQLRSEGEKHLIGKLVYPSGQDFDDTQGNIVRPLLVSLHSAQHLIKILDTAVSSLTEGLYKIQIQILYFFFDDNLAEKDLPTPRNQKEWEKHTLGRLIKAATLEKFLDILVVSYQALLKVLCHTVSVYDYMTEFTKSEASGWTSVVGKAEDIRLEPFEEIQTVSSHLLGLRFESNSRLGTKDFYRLHKLVWAFIDHIEVVVDRPASVLRSSFLSHTHSFFHNFHEEKMKHVALNVDSDPWSSASVASDYQQMANMLRHVLIHGVNHPQLFYGSDPPPQLSLENVDQLAIGEVKYFVSISGLALLQMLLDYLRCAANLPTLAQEVANRMVTLLDNFNQLVCQAVLGAGAMRTAGLNRISARHISVAAQTVAMTQALIPGLSSCLELCTGKILVNQLQRVAQDLAEHQSQLHSKLVTILADRATIHLAKMHKVDWDGPVPDSASQYMLDLVNDVQSLHRIMSRYLRPKETQDIVTKVNKEYALALEQVISTLSIRTPSAKRHLLLDVQYLISQLSALSTQVSNLHHLEVVVNDIPL